MEEVDRKGSRMAGSPFPVSSLGRLSKTSSLPLSPRKSWTMDSKAAPMVLKFGLRYPRIETAMMDHRRSRQTMMRRYWRISCGSSQAPHAILLLFLREALPCA